MWFRNNMANLSILLSLVPLGFLIYTLFHLEELQIKITHPRVIVETLLFLIIGAFAFYMKS